MITVEGIQVDPNKTAAIADRAVPRNVKEVQSFLQACSWYRTFVDGFARIAKPLSDLTKKNVKFVWEPPQQNAYDELKKRLTSTPILQQADVSKPFVVRTDAGSIALGAVLLQGEGAEEHPIEYASRLLTKPEKNYSTTEREALAVVWALNKFRGYIECSAITVSTDHQPLRWLMSIKSPTGRLARWALLIQSFDIKIDYLPGKSNVVGDMLSRPPCDHETASCDTCEVDIRIPRRSAEELRREQMKDPELLKIIQSFENIEDNNFSTWTDRGYLMSSGVLYKYSAEEDPVRSQPSLLFPHRDDFRDQGGGTVK